MGKVPKRGMHQGTEPEMKRFLRKVRKHDLKLVIGRIENCRHSFTPGTVLFKRYVENGILFRGYGGRAVSDLFVYCADAQKETLAKELEVKFNE